MSQVSKWKRENFSSEDAAAELRKIVELQKLPRRAQPWTHAFTKSHRQRMTSSVPAWIRRSVECRSSAISAGQPEISGSTRGPKPLECETYTSSSTFIPPTQATYLSLELAMAILSGEIVRKSL